MPIEHWSIFKRAFHTTIRHPELWLLGLFLAGGFNVNFFYWANLRLRWRTGSSNAVVWAEQHIQATHHVIIASVLLLAVVVAVVIVVNWAKVAFVLHASDILKLQRMRSGEPDEQANLINALKDSPRYLLSVIGMSIFTMVSMSVVVSILGGTAQLLFASRGLVWLVAILVFAGLVFFFSCLNIFATFFIIFYRQGFGAALNLSLDLIMSRWRAIAETAFLLMVVYALCFFVGTSLLFAFSWVVNTITSPLSQAGLVPGIAVFWLTTFVGVVLLWAWSALVNTFFNLSLLLLFANLVRPPYHPEFKSLLVDLPVAASGAVSPMIDRQSP